jgi:hypothetical protein
MGQVANTILASARLTKKFAEAQLKDVAAGSFARLATVGGTTVQSNHPAFVYGHLSLYFPKVLSALGQQAPANPPMFEDCFTNGKPCVDDPEGTKYPAMQTILTHFNNGYEAASAAIARASDAELSRPNPNEGRSKELFPTLGELFNFYMGAHPMSHLGQVSAWRRMMGLGSAM